jgi:hypothetical protein
MHASSGMAISDRQSATSQRQQIKSIARAEQAVVAGILLAGVKTEETWSCELKAQSSSCQGQKRPAALPDG